MDMIMEGRSPWGRIAGLAAVVLFHVVLIYALVTGLARQAVEVVKGPLKAEILDEDKPPPPPPPPPPPNYVPPPQEYVPIPQVTITTPTPTAITVKPTDAPPPANFAPTPQPSAAPPAVVPPTRIGGSCKTPEYPAASERLGEEGTVEVKLDIGPDGKVRGSSVGASSGHSRLDQAALAALSLCQFKPATQNGQTVASSTSIRYHFQAPK